MAVDIERILRKAIKTGKVFLGSKRTIKALKNGEAKVVVIAANCPSDVKSKIEKFNVPVIEFKGTNMELGAVCGKPFSVAALAVADIEESEILNVV
jgi:large subunit ribosomal protein L30e